MPISRVNPFVDRLRNLFERIAKLKYPTVAYMDGIALGGGLELAIACDLRYASKLRFLISSEKCQAGCSRDKAGYFPSVSRWFNQMVERVGLKDCLS